MRSITRVRGWRRRVTTSMLIIRPRCAASEPPVIAMKKTE
jgi:hypothetical protein